MQSSDFLYMQHMSSTAVILGHDLSADIFDDMQSVPCVQVCSGVCCVAACSCSSVWCRPFVQQVTGHMVALAVLCACMSRNCRSTGCFNAETGCLIGWQGCMAGHCNRDSSHTGTAHFTQRQHLAAATGHLQGLCTCAAGPCGPRPVARFFGCQHGACKMLCVCSKCLSCRSMQHHVPSVVVKAN